MKFDEIDKKIYRGDPNEMIGRYVTNSLGIQQVAIMPKLHWDYLDWLESIGGNVAEFVKDCDVARQDHDLGIALQA